MADIKPFKATVINPKLDINKLVCPVYDTIDAVNYKKFATEKNNIIHVTTRRKDMDRDDFIDYAQNNLKRFISSNILIEREKPAFYIYGITYSLPNELLTQLPQTSRKNHYFVFGLVSLVKVEELGKGNIAGHENIFEVNTKERYRLMNACRMNFSPIAAQYSMPKHELNTLFEDYLGFKRPNYIPNPEKPPLVDVTLNGNRHLLWEITDTVLIDKITKIMSHQKLLILDGHHRYTASNLMREKDGVEYSMMMLMERDDKALLLLPWHRTVRNFSLETLEEKIKEKFSIVFESETANEDFYSCLRKRNDAYDVKIGIYNGTKFKILRADENAVIELSKKKNEIVGLDLIVLHEWIINQIIRGKPEDDVFFNASPSEAILRVNNKEFDIAFLLNPIPSQDVEKKAFIEHKNFPQKSTLYLPKVAEGIVMRKIN